MSERNGAGGVVIEAIAHTLEDNNSRKVFGEPVTVGDVTVIPAARLIGRGGGGGGGGSTFPAHEKGGGSGKGGEGTGKGGDGAGKAGDGTGKGGEGAGKGTEGSAGKGPTVDGQTRDHSREHGGSPATGEGSGGGLVQSARPVGAFVIKGRGVSWRPAVDVNRIVLGGQIVAIVGLFVLRALIKHHAHHHHHRSAHLRSAWRRSRRIHRHR